MDFLTVKNNCATFISKIPVLPYERYYQAVLKKLKNEEAHCVNYYAYLSGSQLKFICAIANDKTQNIEIVSHEIAQKNLSDIELPALTEKIPAMHIFEREIHETFGVNFQKHPWLKPVRFAHDRKDQKKRIIDYPFYEINSEQLHEVGVGPIHAGVIEPGHFRFICNGENVLHLEIQLGWQHRGVEALFLKNKSWLYRNLLAESIAGDTSIGHSIAFVSAVEALAGHQIPRRLEYERIIALELERIAMHTGDMSALCTDIAYQLGAVVFGVLRTPIVNFMQRWCGNRLGKSLIRIDGSHYPLTAELRMDLKRTLKDYESKFLEMVHKAYHLVSLQDRFDYIGTVTKKQMQNIGAVGMAARMAGLGRDVRQSHPFSGWKYLHHKAILLESGDVFARFLLRSEEIQQSISLIKELLGNDDYFSDDGLSNPSYEIKLPTNSLCLSLSEGWRGEICHVLVSDDNGDLLHYKIKDPSLHNWKALEISLRDLEISDFPINNKSYDLSYCGHDL